MGELAVGLIWLVVLLAGNAFFVGAEFAVISARRSQIEPRAAAGSRAARTTLYAMEHATLMLATSQLGITVCSLLILTVSEPAIHHFLEKPLGLTGMSPEVISITAFLIALVLVTFLHVVFGEMVPKNLAFSVPDRAALILAPPLVMVSRAVGVVIGTLNWIANGILRLCGVEPKDEATSTYTLDEVARIIEHSESEGTLSDGSGTLRNAFEFTDRAVADVEIPRVEVVTLPLPVSVGDLHRAVAEHGHSRYLVTDAAGQLVGYLHFKDVLAKTGDEYADEVPAKRIRRLIAVPRDADLEDAMSRMRDAGVHVARTVDDVGATVGVLFMEDVLEVLVGEIEDAAVR